jgi:hypothetical protein
MSAGRKLVKEIYVGFLLFLLAFLYLSHLNREPTEAKFEGQPAKKMVQGHHHQKLKG